MIAILSLTATWFAMSSNAGRRKLAPLIGLSSQPFWFHATISAGQWGMVALCAAYTSIYARAAWVHWRRRDV